MDRGKRSCLRPQFWIKGYMKIELHSTADVVLVNGVECRIWDGVTDAGVPCRAFIALVQVSIEEDCTEFEQALEERQCIEGYE